MTSRRFDIKLDQGKTRSTVQEMESSSLFQCLIQIRELVLTDDESAVVFEIARRGEASLDDLAQSIGLVVDLPEILAGLIAHEHLLERETSVGKMYRLSPKLTPPTPITSDDALQIRRNMTEAGRQGFLESYIRELYRTQGDQGLAVVAKIMTEKGQELAEQVSQVRGMGAKIVGLRFVELMKAMGAPLSIVSISDQEVRFRVEKCAYNLQEGEMVLCEAVSYFDTELVSKLGCTISYPKSVPRGDAYCEGVVTNHHSQR